MSEEAFCRNMEQLGKGITLCIRERLQLPALIQLYSAIDIAGWLGNDDPNATNRASFTAWVDGYLLKAMPLPCTALDIYAARCGLVHSLTSDARLIDQSQARRICYAWGDASASNLQETIDHMGQTSALVAVHIHDLYEAWRRGLNLFHGELQSDSPRAAKVYARAARFFDQLPTEVVTRALDMLSG
jgi:hypothetical protein